MIYKNIKCSFVIVINIWCASRVAPFIPVYPSCLRRTSCVFSQTPKLKGIKWANQKRPKKTRPSDINRKLPDFNTEPHIYLGAPPEYTPLPVVSVQELLKDVQIQTLAVATYMQNFTQIEYLAKNKTILEKIENIRLVSKEENDKIGYKTARRLALSIKTKGVHPDLNPLCRLLKKDSIWNNQQIKISHGLAKHYFSKLQIVALALKQIKVGPSLEEIGKREFWIKFPGIIDKRLKLKALKIPEKAEKCRTLEET
eukprot:GHVL01030493.1.p1 GENE.GHVL01030493.1~~GHVL01030493.1.p1  ORF type:complete len:255 (+),score=38.40 GHVL01030493.1:151-915(+)